MAKQVIKITEKELTDIVKNTIIESINESTPHEKKRNNDNIINAFKKGKRGYNAIKTFAVFTAENPNSKRATASYNKKANKTLLNDLKNANYVIVPAIGKFGNSEHPYAVINISVETASFLCGKYEQTSFVFSVLMDDGHIHSEYWEKKNIDLPYNKEKNNYVKKDESDEWVDETNSTDNFTIIGHKFKYSIPFSIFENISRQIYRNVDRIVEAEKKKGNMINPNNLIDFSINKIGMASYLRRKAINNNIIL